MRGHTYSWCQLDILPRSFRPLEFPSHLKKMPGLFNQEHLQHLTCPALTQQVYSPYSLCIVKGVSADGPRRP